MAVWSVLNSELPHNNCEKGSILCTCHIFNSLPDFARVSYRAHVCACFWLLYGDGIEVMRPWVNEDGLSVYAVSAYDLCRAEFIRPTVTGRMNSTLQFCNYLN